MITKKIIYGCETRGDSQSPYLTRYTLFQAKSFQVCLHIFHRSDSPELHDHPWPFVSFLLWRGYAEETIKGKSRKWPGMVLIRPPEWTHRVELIDEKPAITLVIMGKRVREWGFITQRGWQLWRDYFLERGC